MTENAFLKGLMNVSNVALTENGAIARETTQSAMLDYFAQGGAIREQSPEMQVAMFARAWGENPLLALKALFYFRNPRGGQGQREAFRNQLNFLASIAPETVIKNLLNVPEFGRWDDLYALVDTSVEHEMFMAIKSQLSEDMIEASNVSDDVRISLLAKWLKSENASAIETKRLGRKTRQYLQWSSEHYRKVLSHLRGKLNLTERMVSSGQWAEVPYSAVPSNAMMKYRKAFARHDADRFGKFIEDATSGDAKINASVLYPHEIVGKLMRASIAPSVAQAMWNNLPDYTGEPENSIAVVDTSMSMSGTPMEVAISLGLYLAERAPGPFRDHFITFSQKPTLQRIHGDSLAAKVIGLRHSEWMMNTNIEAVFDLVLSTAVKNGLSQDDMIDKIYIISDMEFDKATGPAFGWYDAESPDKTVFDTIRQKFGLEGYEMPNLVFWNVDARNVQFPMQMDDRGFQMVSGFSPSILQSLMTGEFVSAYDLMLNVLNDVRYNGITL